MDTGTTPTPTADPTPTEADPCAHCSSWGDVHEIQCGPEIRRLLRDEDCPECGWPETFAEVDLTAATPGADALGCSKCGWRIEAGR